MRGINIVVVVKLEDGDNLLSEFGRYTLDASIDTC
jgi:hypothetical protein